MADITYDLLRNISAFKHLPVLTLDPRWYELVPDISKTDEIKFWEQQVNALLKRQGQVTNDIKDVKKLKTQLIQSVVQNMEEDGDTAKHRKRMSQSQRLIYEAKDKIAKLEEESEELPRQLEKANQNLMIETVKMCYARINENKEDLEVLDKWIAATRLKLKKNLLIKQDKETVNAQMYSGMHDILGPEMMSALDRINDTSAQNQTEE